MTDLYIATRSDAPDIVKVGRSNNPRRRCEGLSSSHCFTVSTAFIFHGHGRVEAAVHKALEDKRVLGGTGKEWFRVSAAEAFAAVTHALGTPERNHDPHRYEPSGIKNHAACGLARRRAYDYEDLATHPPASCQLAGATMTDPSCGGSSS